MCMMFLILMVEEASYLWLNCKQVMCGRPVGIKQANTGAKPNRAIVPQIQANAITICHHFEKMAMPPWPVGWMRNRPVLGAKQALSQVVSQAFHSGVNLKHIF